MAQNIKVDGNKERFMERARDVGQTVMFTKETGKVGRDTGKEYIITVMDRYMKESSRTIYMKEREFILGQTAEDTKETGRKTK